MEGEVATSRVDSLILNMNSNEIEQVTTYWRVAIHTVECLES